MALVTVASFPTSHEAALAKARLEEADIRAVVRGDQNARLFGGMGALAGTVDVQVHSDDEDAARSILALDLSGYDESLTAMEAEAADDAEYADLIESGGAQCPRCDSGKVIVSPMSWGAFLFGLLLLGIPFLFLKQKHECKNCGMIWKENPGRS